MRLEGLFIVEKQWKTLHIPKPNPRRRNAKLWAPFLGKLVHQLPGVANWSYYLRLTCMIARWKDPSEDYDGSDFYQKNRWGGFPKKLRLGPQNGSGSLGPEKLLKIVNCATITEIEKLKETVVGVKIG